MHFRESLIRPGVRIIAEFKRASPSLGDIAPGADPAERAVAAGADIVGVNSRDLETLSVDIAVAERLLGRIPDGVVRVAESGVATRADVERLAAAGADAFLVGTALMRAADPAEKLMELKGER